MTMTEKTFSVPNISCGHCTRTIENELSEMTGVTRVAGSPQDKTVTIAWDDPATEDAIRATLKEINYPAE